MSLKTTAAGALAAAIIIAASFGGTASAQAAGAAALVAKTPAPISQSASSELHKVGHRFKRRGFKRFKRFGHFNRFGHFEHRHFSHGHGCGFYKRKWLWTGSHFWKKKYKICRGWW